METTPFFDSFIFGWIVIPLLIFSARIVDVSLGTIRIIYVSRGLKYVSPIVGFFEIMIWLLAIGQIFQNLTNPIYYLAYALGFASGNFVGIIIEERLAMGRVAVRIITQVEASGLISALRKEGYGVTAVNAEGSMGPVKLIFTIVDRGELEHVVNLVKTFNPKAFFSVEDVRMAREGIFPPARSSITNLLKHIRKGK
ncbi:MAG: DUF2179 domain-containing protein [Syntrophales bacterium]|nr:DUF2179 domain-containing protein [Syntrophales bacterium]